MKRTTLEDRMAADAMASIIFNLFLWISGVVLISMAYQSWEVGLGVGAFLLFMKGGK
jgi:hypothetical protein